MKLWYSKPASVFEEALPVGNGRLGAMVYGGIIKERLSLNEDTCWAGYPQDKSDSQVKTYLEKARRLIANGNKKEAEEITWKHMMSTWTESYQPVGNLIIDMQHSQEAIAYKRELDLENAVARTVYEIDGIEYRRKVYISYPDQVIVVHLSASQKGALCFKARLESLHPVEIKSVASCANELQKAKHYYIMTGKVPAYTAPSYYEDQNPIQYEVDGQCGLTFVTGIATHLVGGRLSVNNEGIEVENADEVSLYINIATNYQGRSIAPKLSTVNAQELCLDRLIELEEKVEQDIFKKHKEDYKKLYNRVEFNLETEKPSELPTDARIKASIQDKQLPVLLFNYGRYLLIASSRLHSQPANLQGIWNERLRAPWSSNYTLNINAQMNYWLAEVTHLSECHMPLIEYIKDLSEKGRQTAKNNYGNRGWCAHHNADIWAQTEPVGKLSEDRGCNAYSFWPHGGNWLIHHIWEHYEFTQDIEFLKTYKEIIYGAGYFLIDWVVERDGKMVMTPSISPENMYLENGERLAICENSAMDLALLQEVMSICIKVNQLLGDDQEFLNQCMNVLSKIPDYQIGSKGQLLEWDKEYEELEPLHRHLSLLYGFYPASVMNHKDTPHLIDAIKKTMRLRGDMATGWGIAWKINVWARLRDGEHAKVALDYMLGYVDAFKSNKGSGGGVYPNMLCAHPPFQIDGNFGATAGIAEMLLQSHGGFIHLLPALPNQWDKGCIRGLMARGGVQVDMEWENTKLKKATLKAFTNVTKKVIYKDNKWDINLNSGDSIELYL